MKPKIYIETSIPSYLTARPSNDIRVVANQNTTFEWWEMRRPNFDLFISEFVLTVASLGRPEAVKKRLEVIAELPKLATTNEVRELAKTLTSEGAVRQKPK